MVQSALCHILFQGMLMQVKNAATVNKS